MVQNPGGGLGVPGLLTRRDQTVITFLLHAEYDHVELGVLIEKDTVDTGGTPTTNIRAGTALVRVETGANKNKWVTIGHADAPAAGAIVRSGFISHFQSMLSDDGITVEDKQANVVIDGFVDNAKLNYNTADGPTITAIRDQVKRIDFEIAVP